MKGARRAGSIRPVSRRCPSCGTEYEESVAFCGNDGTITVHVQAPGEEPDRRLGRRFGDYVVVQRVADGAMGRVYEGRHATTRQKVAVKILHDDVAKDRIAVERFKREFETANELQSPYVVRVIDFGGTGDGSFYLTMEFLGGEELGALLRREGAQPVARVVRILAQAACGLEDAHSFGVIHRDLKPDNLFLVSTPEGDALRLLDFGSVKLQMETGPKLTAFGTTLGSPYYMSPEQAMGRADVDNRTDLFALSAITYEMLSGKIAFDGPAVAQILMKIVSDMPPPLSSQRPGSSPALDDVLEKALAKDKQHRHESTVAFAADVLGALGLLPPGATTDRAAVEAWGQKPVAVIEAALAAATPRAALAFGAPAAAAASVTPASVSPARPSGVASVAPPVPSQTALWIGLAGVAVLATALAGLAAAYFLGMF